jgi:hypothetical protein
MKEIFDTQWILRDKIDNCDKISPYVKKIILELLRIVFDLLQYEYAKGL